MPFLDTGKAHLYYEDVGSGPVVFLLAPGGMKSAIDFWHRADWNPITELAGSHRVIAMDQRNAGKSSAPVTAHDSWQTYSSDQLAVLDHLGVDQFHVMGMCIGGPYAMGLIEAVPQRVRSAVLFQSIGLMADDKNRDAFYAMFDGWAEELRESSAADANDWQSFRSNMYDGDNFLFNVDDEFVAQLETPLCVLEGNDLYHPKETSLRIRELAADVLYIESWKEPAVRSDAMRQVREFLAQH